MMNTYAGLQEMIAEDQERKADLTEVPLLTELFELGQEVTQEDFFSVDDRVSLARGTQRRRGHDV